MAQFCKCNELRSKLILFIICEFLCLLRVERRDGILCVNFHPLQWWIFTIILAVFPFWMRFTHTPIYYYHHVCVFVCSYFFLWLKWSVYLYDRVIRLAHTCVQNNPFMECLFYWIFKWKVFVYFQLLQKSNKKKTKMIVLCVGYERW